MVGRSLPTALRTFVLTLAVVEDLLAIVIIAVFYAAQLSVLPLLGALVPIWSSALSAGPIPAAAPDGHAQVKGRLDVPIDEATDPSG